MMIEEL